METFAISVIQIDFLSLATSIRTENAILKSNAILRTARNELSTEQTAKRIP